MNKWLQASTIKPNTYLRTSSQTAPGCPPLDFTTAFKRLGNNLEHWATAEGNLPRWCSLHCRLISLWDFSENYKRLGWTHGVAYLEFDCQILAISFWLSTTTTQQFQAIDQNQMQYPRKIFWNQVPFFCIAFTSKRCIGLGWYTAVKAGLFFLEFNVLAQPLSFCGYYGQFGRWVWWRTGEHKRRQGTERGMGGLRRGCLKCQPCHSRACPVT